MVVVIIRTQLRADADAALYARVSDEMDLLVRAMPGFISAKDFTSDDGDRISLVIFDSHEALLAWRNLPAHVEAQRLGKEQIYLSYSVQVCEVARSYQFP